MILAQQSMTIVHLFRVLFTVIDRVVYWAIMEIYNLIDQISRINIFDESTLSEFSTRIYMIIGVLMLFKLAFSVLTYIVDPDKLADSKKGFSAIVKNVIIMLALIVTVPLIFKYAMALQYVVVSDNTIGRLITGKEGGSTANVGDNMSVAILSGFIHPDSGIGEGCENWSQSCEDALSKYNLNVTYHNAYFGERGYNYLLELANSTETMGDGNYVIVYNVILSTLVGGFTAWILLMFCIDIAVRIVKLGFLQLIAPIPIVTYMDDGGQGVFKKWVKVCTSTYADLFIRLAAINFAIYVISVFLISSDTDQNALLGTFKMCEWSFNAGTLTAVCDKKPGVFVRLFLILGTLMFAKQLPKIIEEITGLKLDGGFTLNPMKKLSEVPLIGGIGAAGVGLAGAGLLAGGRLGTGLVKGVGAGALSAFKGNTFQGGFKSSFSTDAVRAGMRMKAGLGVAKGNLSNWSGTGKYSTMGDSYKKMTENYSKGKEAFDKIDADWTKGAKAQKRFTDAGYSWDDFNGASENLGAYQSVYNHDEFIQSLMNTDRQDAKNKEYINALYAAQVEGSSFGMSVDAQGNRIGVEVGGKKYAFEADESRGIHSIAELKSDAEKAQKTLSGLEKVHETMRLKYADDAETQDVLKTKKYNSENPTGKEHKVLERIGKI